MWLFELLPSHQQFMAATHIFLAPTILLLFLLNSLVFVAFLKLFYHGAFSSKNATKLLLGVSLPYSTELKCFIRPII